MCLEEYRPKRSVYSLFSKREAPNILELEFILLTSSYASRATESISTLVSVWFTS